jgi:hypothetical protein
MLSGAKMRLTNGGATTYWTSDSLRPGRGSVSFLITTGGTASTLQLEADSAAFTGTISQFITKVYTGTVLGARRIYVRPSTGDDTRGAALATATATPLASLSAAAGHVRKGLGDQVLMAEGETTAAGLPTMDGLDGYSQVYPTAFQTYDPADPTNEAKIGRATSGRPIINTGNNTQVLISGRTNYVVIRGFDSNPGNVSGSIIQFFAGGGVSSDYLLIENNIFRYTQLTDSQGDDVQKGIHHIFRGNAIYGAWNTSANAHGIFEAGIINVTVEDNVFYHTGWKIGALRTDDKSIGGTVGDEAFRHSLYHQLTSDGTIRRNLIAQPCSTGLSIRGGTSCYGNVLLRCPTHINSGGGDNQDVHRPLGVILDIGYNLCIGNEYSATYPLIGGINNGNGRLGSQIHHNVFARSGAVSLGITFGTLSNYSMPSYIHIHHNREHLWAQSGNNYTITNTGGGTSIPTYDNNISSDPTTSENTNYLSSLPTTAYTEDSLAAAGGYTDYATLMAYAIAHPEAHPAQVLHPIGMAGYNIDLTNYATPVTLLDVALDDVTYATGTPQTGQIVGVMPNATLSATGLPTGFTINAEKRQWAWAGGSAGSTTTHLTQTLNIATNTPKTTDIGVTVS